MVLKCLFSEHRFLENMSNGVTWSNKKCAIRVDVNMTIILLNLQNYFLQSLHGPSETEEHGQNIVRNIAGLRPAGQCAGLEIKR